MYTIQGSFLWCQSILKFGHGTYIRQDLKTNCACLREGRLFLLKIICDYCRSKECCKQVKVPIQVKTFAHISVLPSYISIFEVPLLITFVCFSWGENGYFRIKRGSGHCGIGSLHQEIAKKKFKNHHIWINNDIYIQLLQQNENLDMFKKSEKQGLFTIFINITYGP